MVVIISLFPLGCLGLPCLTLFSPGIKVPSETPQSLECLEFHHPWHAHVVQDICKLPLNPLFHVCSLESCTHVPPICLCMEMVPFSNTQSKCCLGHEGGLWCTRSPPYLWSPTAQRLAPCYGISHILSYGTLIWSLLARLESSWRSRRT